MEPLITDLQKGKREARNEKLRPALERLTCGLHSQVPRELHPAKLSNCKDTLKSQLPNHYEVEYNIRYPKGGGGRVKSPGYGENVGGFRKLEWVICSQDLSTLIFYYLLVLEALSISCDFWF
jgi:hypothetical protein